MGMSSTVYTLAGEIGPRGTGTPGEEAAADYVAGELTGLGLPVERYVFRALPSQNGFPLAINLLALLAAVLYPLDGPPLRWVATALACSTGPLLWQVTRGFGGLLRSFLPKVTSRNVVARLPSRREPRQRVVILAHLDTNRCRTIWQSALAHRLRPLTYLTLGVLTVQGILYLIGTLTGTMWPWWAGLLPAGYALGSVVALVRDDRAPYTHGAHDNAASVAVALELAARLVARPLERTEVWLAFTGAEETDHAGLHALLRRDPSGLRDATFIGLEGIGSGEIVYLARHGLCDPRSPPADLLALVERVATRHDVRAARMTMEDETTVLLRRGYRAICIAGRDPTTGTLPRWHRLDDTPETVSEEVMAQAAEFVMAVLREMDEKEE